MLREFFRAVKGSGDAAGRVREGLVHMALALRIGIFAPPAARGAPARRRTARAWLAKWSEEAPGLLFGVHGYVRRFGARFAPSRP